MATGRRVTLSFDNGPDPGGTTDDVLKLLRARGLKASFFVTGQQLEMPGAMDVVRRVQAEGHRIGNHTYSHSTMFGDSKDPDLPAREIGRVDELLRRGGAEMGLFRPYGAGGALSPLIFSADAIEYLQAGMHTVVLWNSVPRDWEQGPGWVDRCMVDIAGSDWSLVVLHDIPEGGTRFLANLLDRVEDLGVEVVQEFPDTCVPLRKGQRTGAMSDLLPAT
jgi:peptidoglycan-N-acetylglucosamine deacetylase